MITLLAALLLGVAHAADPVDDPPPPAPAGPYGLEGPVAERYVDITTNEFAWDEAVVVGEGTIVDDHVKITLRSGISVPLKTASGAAVGAYFQGDCAIAYTPPLGEERRNFEIRLGLRDLETRDCTELYVVTDDADLLAALGLNGGEAAETAPSATGWLQKLRKGAKIPKLDDQFEPVFGTTVVLRALDALAADQAAVPYLKLFARVVEPGPLALFPKAEPWNTFQYRRGPVGSYEPNEGIITSVRHVGEGQHSYDLPLTSHPRSGRTEDIWQPPNLDLVSAEVDLDIQIGLKLYATMDATAKLTMTTTRSPVSTVTLDLLRTIRYKGIPDLLGFDVLEVTDFKGRPLDFIHSDYMLVVRLRSPLPPGQAEVLNIKYTGNAMPRLSDDSFGLLANYAWWPQPGNHDRHTWKVNVCLPRAFHAVGTGTTLSSKVTEGRRCEVWEETVPVSFAAINVGRWDTQELDGKSGAKLRGFFLKEESQHMEPALYETDRILTFFEDLLGPYPYEELDIALARENMGFWQAPAGLLELSKMEYSVRKTAKKDQRSDFYPKVSIATLSHEIAHQWWGHVVGWKTYRDQWISETFAEYLSFLYMSQHYGEESYLGRLEYWEQAARRSDKYGPATLGFRIGQRAYIGQVYRRGPYVLHMLRRMVGDKAFMGWLKEVTTIASNRNLSTGDLLIITEKTLGEDASKHFQSWMFDTGLPDLELSYREDGKKLKITLEQTQPEPPRQLLVPVQLIGKKGKPKLHTLATDSRSLEVELPLPPGGLKKIKIDPERELLTGKKEVRQADEERKTGDEGDEELLDSDESVDAD